MRILLLTETLPFPLDSGGRIKTYHTIRMLAARHEVHCHALTREEAPDLKPLETLCSSVVAHRIPGGPVREGRVFLRSLCGGPPLMIARHFDRQIAAAVDEAARRLAPDVVYCDHVSMMAYATRLHRPIVCDTHNVEHLLVRRYAEYLRRSPRWVVAQREWRALRRFEREAYAAADVVLTVSEIDAKAIAVLIGSAASVRVVPVALDVAGVSPIAPLAHARRLLYIGGLHWPPNLDAMDYFSRQILPLVRRKIPDVEMLIVGRNDVAGIAALSGRPGVRLAGRVPDVVPFLRTSRMMIVPLRSGSGVRVKILDAFAHGVPVVSTTLGHEGLEITPGVELLAADEPADFARCIVQVLQDDGLASALAAAGRRLALARHDIGVVATALSEAIELAVGRDRIERRS